MKIESSAAAHNAGIMIVNNAKKDEQDKEKVDKKRENLDGME